MLDTCGICWRSLFIMLYTRQLNMTPRCDVWSSRRVTLCEGYALLVSVRDNNVDQALRALKKKMQREGIFREMKLRRSFEKPSEKRARERAEAVRRHRKMLRKRLEREGY